MGKEKPFINHHSYLSPQSCPLGVQSSALSPQSSSQDLGSLWGSHHAAQAVGLGEREQGSLEERPKGP